MTFLVHAVHNQSQPNEIEHTHQWLVVTIRAKMLTSKTISVSGRFYPENLAELISSKKKNA